MKAKERPVYEVTTYINRATEQTYVAQAGRLSLAVKLFHAQVAEIISDRGACVLLVRVQPDQSGIVLASKSTDQTVAVFEPAYYREAE